VADRLKWDAWKKLGDMNKETAKQKYMEALSKLEPQWQQRAKL